MVKSQWDAHSAAVGDIMNRVEREWRNSDHKNDLGWVASRFREEKAKLVIPEELSKYLETFHPPL